MVAFADIHVILQIATRPGDFRPERHTTRAVRLGSGRIYVGQVDVTARVAEICPTPR